MRCLPFCRAKRKCRNAWPGVSAFSLGPKMQKRLARLAMQRVESRHGTHTGHTFHYSSMTTGMSPVLTATHATTGVEGEAIYRHGPITATYMHTYWPTNPAAAAALFRGETL